MTLLYLSLAYLIGITLGQWAWQAGWVGCDLPTWLWLPLLGALPLTPLTNRLVASSKAEGLRWPQRAGFRPPRAGPSPGIILALALCCLAGMARYAAHPVTPCLGGQNLAFYNAPAQDGFSASGANVTVVGYVNTYPLRQDTRQRLDVQVESLVVDGTSQPVAGQLRLTTGIATQVTYGQPVRVTGILSEPPQFEGFDYRAYLARKNVHSLMQRPRITPIDGPNRGAWLKRTLYALRARSEILLNRLLPEPYAALANGMLLGIESGIPDELYDQFNLTGTSHVIVISGSNVALVAGVLMGIFARTLGRRRAIAPTLAGIGLYALLVGGDAAVLRAALMGGLFVWATAINRGSTALVSLGAACWAMTVANPLMFWDVGFQLSSAATAGLILFSPGLSQIARRWLPGFSGGVLTAGFLAQSGVATAARGVLQGLLQDGLIVTLAANLTTLPLVVYYFGRLSLISLITNVLILPVQPLIMFGGLAGLALGLSGMTLLAQIVLWMPWLSLAWTVKMVQWSASLPGASLEIMNFGGAALFLTYAALLGLGWRHRLAGWARQWAESWRKVRPAWPRMLAGPTGVGMVGVAAILVWGGALGQPDGYLHVHFLDVGQGDGIFIQTPSGRQVLVDGGLSPQVLYSELGAVMPFWDRSLDLMIASHPDGDHIGGQTTLPQRFRIGMALDTAAAQANQGGEAWRLALAEAGTPVALQELGGWIDLGDEVALWVLWPPPGGVTGEGSDNENSLVLRLVYGEFSLLLTGDAGIPSEAAMLAAGLPVAATVLKAGHHGSRFSSGAAFVQAVNPLAAVIQVGENRYGHPADEALERLAGRLILRNDQHGRIYLRTDGERMWLGTERGKPLGF